MATVADVITKIGAANTLLKNNLTAKGVTVPDGETTYAMAKLVESVKTTQETTQEITPALLLHCDDYLDSGYHKPAVTNSGASIDSVNKKFGSGSFSFDNSSDFVSIPQQAFSFSLSDFTIDLWLFPTAFTGGILGIWDGANPFLLSTTSAGGVLFAMHPIDGGIKIVQTDDGVLLLNQWQHVAVTRSQNAVRLFINGKIKKTEEYSAALATPNKPLCIGKNPDAFASGDHTTGNIDEVRILNGFCAWENDFTPPVSPYASWGAGA